MTELEIRLHEVKDGKITAIALHDGGPPTILPLVQPRGLDELKLLDSAARNYYLALAKARELFQLGVGAAPKAETPLVVDMTPSKLPTLEYFHVPADFESGYSYTKFQRRAIKLIMEALKDGSSVAPSDVSSKGNWIWAPPMAAAALKALAHIGTVTRSGADKGHNVRYQLVTGHPATLHAFIRDKGFATPESVAEHYWVPEDLARAWLQSAEGAEVRKHPRKDEWFPADALPAEAAEDA